MNQERNMKFMQIAMNYLPEAKGMLEQSGVEVSMDNIQPMLEVLMKVMSDAYELGHEDALKEKE